MAANNNYRGHFGTADHSPPPAHYNGAYYGTSGSSTPAPSYQSSYPSAAPSYNQGPYDDGYAVHSRTAQSPFDSVFDDPETAIRKKPYTGDSSGSSLAHGDTTHYGYHGSSLPQKTSPSHVSEDIPLQDQIGKNNTFNDHVYDAPDAAQAPRRPKSKGKVRLGELGMFGADRKRIPWITYLFTLAQVAVFIGELIRNGVLTGSPIMIKPQFNPMIGPSTQVMINMGARYVPCMHNVKEIQGSDVPVLFLCPNATSNDQFCPLSELCGFGGVPDPTFNNADQKPAPDQWYRFITPIFMHAGLIHIGFNLLLQMTIGKEMEMAIGPIRFFLVYMSAGIFGFVMGGNFAAPGIASTGASGSLFGIIALTLLDLLYSWKDRRSPVKDLVYLIIDMVISFVLGLLPGLDNFSHIGGFLMGLCLGISILHSPNSLRRRLGHETPYSAVGLGGNSGGATTVSFFKSPLGFFRGRKPLWWAWWLVRVAALVCVITVFIVLVNNFYNVTYTCTWCKYLSCLPVSNWCEIGTIKQQTQN